MFSENKINFESNLNPYPLLRSLITEAYNLHNFQKNRESHSLLIPFFNNSLTKNLSLATYKDLSSSTLLCSTVSCHQHTATVTSRLTVMHSKQFTHCQSLRSVSLPRFCFSKNSSVARFIWPKTSSLARGASSSKRRKAPR